MRSGSNRRISNQHSGFVRERLPGSTWQGRPPFLCAPRPYPFLLPGISPSLFGRCFLVLSRNPRAPPTPGTSPFHWTFVSLSIGSFLPFEPGFVPFRGTVGSSFDGQAIRTHFHRSTSKARSKRARRAHVKRGEAKARTQGRGTTSQKLKTHEKTRKKTTQERRREPSRRTPRADEWCRRKLRDTWCWRRKSLRQERIGNEN